jgi:hypothetical protein
MVIDPGGGQNDHYEPRTGAAYKLARMFETPGTDSGARPERRVVRDCDGFVEILGRYNGLARPEDLFPAPAHLVRGVEKYARPRKVPARTQLTYVATYHLCAFVARYLRVLGVRLELFSVL